MSNITELRPTRRVTVTKHQVTFDLIPLRVIEDLFHAAIAVGWAADEDGYTAVDEETQERLASLQKAVSAASQFTTPVVCEVDEPIGSGARPEETL